MTKHLYRLGMVLAMSAGFALAQSTAAPSTTPKTFPDQTQTPSAQQAPATTQPQSSDQMPSSTQAPSSSTTPSASSSTSPDQSTSTPSTSAPQTDQSTSSSSSSPSSSSSSQSTSPSSPSSSSASGMPKSDMGSSGDVSKIESALQQNPNLSGVTVNSTDKGIELTGSANSAKDRKEAVRIAKENGNGKKVIDHIQVAGGATSNNPK